MSSTHDPQQPCHIDRLPNELLEEILRPPSPPRLSFFGTSSTCDPSSFPVLRVSRRWKAVGSPLQWRDLVVNLEQDRPDPRVADLDAAFLGRPHIAQACRTVKINWVKGIEECTALLGEVSSAFVNVEELVFEGCSPVNLDTLSLFHNLRRLHLEYAYLVVSARPPALCRLTSLSLHHVSVGILGGTFIDISTFPTLRRLSLKGSNLKGATAASHAVFSDVFLRRLEYIQLDVGDLDERRGGCAKIVEHTPPAHLVLLRVLLDGDSDLPVSDALHIRVEPDWDARWGRDVYRGLMRALSDVLSQLGGLRLALVPDDMWRLPRGASDAARRERETILVEAARRRIDIRTYEKPLLVDAAFSPEFSTWLREEASRRAAEE
ncbi:hypothetical protein JCM9279_001939 [Rhodotorula babjevae]